LQPVCRSSFPAAGHLTPQPSPAYLPYDGVSAPVGRCSYHACMSHSDPQALRVLPFRGLRFVPGRVRDPSAFTSPPYDMIGPEEARGLADTEEHNVVRLILAAPEELAEQLGAPARYSRAAASLHAWIGDGA